MAAVDLASVVDSSLPQPPGSTQPQASLYQDVAAAFVNENGVHSEYLVHIVPQEVYTVQVSPPSPPGDGRRSVREMAEPGLSTKYNRPKLVEKLYGLTPEQVARAKALLRLGVTEEDLGIATHLLRMGPFGDAAEAGGGAACTKSERFLGYTQAQMSRLKALEVLGMTEAAFDEERHRTLGSLGPTCFNSDHSETFTTVPDYDLDSPGVCRTAGPCVPRGFAFGLHGSPNSTVSRGTSRDVSPARPQQLAPQQLQRELEASQGREAQLEAEVAALKDMLRRAGVDPDAQANRPRGPASVFQRRASRGGSRPTSA